MATITVDVLGGGAIHVEVDGAAGKSCEGLTAALEEALGVIETRTSKVGEQSAQVSAG